MHEMQLSMHQRSTNSFSHRVLFITYIIYIQFYHCGQCNFSIFKSSKNISKQNIIFQFSILPVSKAKFHDFRVTEREREREREKRRRERKRKCECVTLCEGVFQSSVINERSYISTFYNENYSTYSIQILLTARLRQVKMLNFSFSTNFLTCFSRVFLNVLRF